MLQRVITFLVFFSAFSYQAFAQEEEYESLGVNDSLYREDQIYLGVSYNVLLDMPAEIVPAAFSGGLELGFIRDYPLNERRNIALGVGLGWSFNNYGHNLFIGEETESEVSIFRALDERVTEYEKNRFSVQAVEVPLQFRWRTSTMEATSFWRIYTGIKAGYSYYYRSNFVQPKNIVRQTDIPEFDPWRLGLTFSFGYSTFNFHFYYSLNPFFKEEAEINGETIEMKTLQIGLIFYIL